jgi:bacterioferritin-associated ferredoxin
MIVCHCRAVSDRDVTAAVESGARDISAVAELCGAGGECHGCHDRIASLLERLDDHLLLQRAS